MTSERAATSVTKLACGCEWQIDLTGGFARHDYSCRGGGHPLLTGTIALPRGIDPVAWLSRREERADA